MSILFSSFKEESKETCSCCCEFPNGDRKIKELEKKVKDLAEQLAVANEALRLAANDVEKYQKLYKRQLIIAKSKIK